MSDPQEQSLDQFLGQVNQRLRGRARWRALLYGWVALGVLVAVVPLIANVTSGVTVRWLGLVAAAAVISAVVLAGWLRPRRTYSDTRAAAQHVGRTLSGLSSDLLSAVELRHQANPGSPDLVDALVDSITQQVAPLSPATLVPPRPLVPPAALGLTIVLANLLLALAAPEVLAQGWRALLTSTPSRFGDATVVPLPLVGDLNVTIEYPEYMNRTNGHFPASAGDLHAPLGARIHLETRTLEPVEEAHLLLESAKGTRDAEQKIALGQTLDGRLQTRFVVTGPRRLRFLFEYQTGAKRIEERARELTIDVDREPKIELFAPADNLDVAKLRRIELAYVAEDDYGVASIDLVAERDAQEIARIPMQIERTDPGRPPRATQSKYVWDLAAVEIAPGNQIEYYVEVKDNNDVKGPNISRSRTFVLQVYSDRERHRDLIARQRQAATLLLEQLAGRLTLDQDAETSRASLNQQGKQAAVALGGLISALKADKLTAKELIVDVSAMRDRLDKHVLQETRLLQSHSDARSDEAATRQQERKFSNLDKRAVADLETDVLTLANWLERQELENLLALGDEIDHRQKRIDKLFEELKRSDSAEIRAELARELSNLEQELVQMASQHAQLPSDVLDRFVNADAAHFQKNENCIALVRDLLAQEKLQEARLAMESCTAQLKNGAQQLEQSLASLRGERFPEQEARLNEFMDELAELKHDQLDVAKETQKLSQRYSRVAERGMQERAVQTRLRLDEEVAAFEKKLNAIPKSGLGKFAREEKQIAEKRVHDLQQALNRGDLADALAMAEQIESSMQILQAELRADLDEAWSENTQEALGAIDRVLPLARSLVKRLRDATPAVPDLMTDKDQAVLRSLRKRQQAIRRRTEKLANRADQHTRELPGNSASVMKGGLRRAAEAMTRSEARMQARDALGAALESENAAKQLESTEKDGRGATRQQQSFGRPNLREEPVRIPGSEEYRAPKRFREEILDAMKSDKPPVNYRDQVKRYYQELVR